jgi:mannitol-1-phosphate 5-dehydrogenase
MMNPPKVLIFGAGKTGRGFAGAICARSGLSFALVDQDQRLVEELRETNSYPIQLLGEESEWGTFAFENAWSIAEPAWEEALMEASVCFTAVFGNNLKALGERLAEPLRRRLDYNPEAYLNIITLENQDHAATLLKAAVMAQIHDDEIQHALLQKIGFVEGIVLKTCLGPDTSRAQTMPLLIRAENTFHLPCDGAAFRGPRPELRDLEPVTPFANQLLRKIFTYNGVNAVISYLGYLKGYNELSQAACDPIIAELALKAGHAINQALIAEYRYNPTEQEAWLNAALAKFKQIAIPDPIQRNCADPIRKLARGDRLIGPALLILKHGLDADALIQGTLAAFQYCEPSRPELLLEYAGRHELLLEKICGLEKNEALFSRLLEALRQQTKS